VIGLFNRRPEHSSLADRPAGLGTIGNLESIYRALLTVTSMSQKLCLLQLPVDILLAFDDWVSAGI
jgi:hypothetical protein